tara:strand:- start:1798 stop:2337 length:540 start_codon:yes stop_codon:yes gene_type:complete
MSFGWATILIVATFLVIAIIGALVVLAHATAKQPSSTVVEEDRWVNKSLFAALKTRTAPAFALQVSKKTKDWHKVDNFNLSSKTVCHEKKYVEGVNEIQMPLLSAYDEGNKDTLLEGQAADMNTFWNAVLQPDTGQLRLYPIRFFNRFLTTAQQKCANSNSMVVDLRDKTFRAVAVPTS